MFNPIKKEAPKELTLHEYEQVFFNDAEPDEVHVDIATNLALCCAIPSRTYRCFKEADVPRDIGT